MKSLLNSLFLFVVVIFLSSCKKIGPESIIGKWNIQEDLTYVGVGSNNHSVSYAGQPDDYFNFTSDGHIYSRENSILDTLSYRVSSGSVMIPNFDDAGGVGKGEIKSSSTHSLSISSGTIITPGGAFGRTVSLKR
ncbi:MAG: hypothetical protein ABI185_06230 [Ginsengibacter sp.]